MKKFATFLSLALFLIICNISYAEDEMKDEKEVDIQIGVRIPMKDDINLAAKIWKPSELKEKLPVILWFTPYVSDEQHPDGSYYAKKDYIYISVDVRGRGNSEGECFPLESDGKDGAQVVEWLARQPWCDGRVVMTGGSYRGMVQWQTLRELPPSLIAISPSASVGPGIDYPQPNNIFYSYSTRWLGLVSEHTGNRKLFEDTDFWSRKFYKMYEQGLPFSKLDELTGSDTKIFQRWLAHPEYDDYWRNMTPAPEDYSKFNIPILTITGYFDDDQPGAMNYYNMHNLYGTAKGKENHFLVIGPYDHGGTRRPSKELGGLKFDDNCVLDMNKLQLEYFDWILKGESKPDFLKKRVAYYMMGENNWKYADKIEEISNKIIIYYLSSFDGKANDVFNSGFLTEKEQDKQKHDTYEYNPANLIDKDKYLTENPNYLIDQSTAFRKDILVYHSQALEKPMEIAGYLKLKLYMELNVPDMDFSVNLYEIKPDGTSIFLANDILRARYRNSLSKAELVKSGEINLYEFKKFYFFARKIEKGSRIRLVVGALNSPEYEKNYNSGGFISEETLKDAKKATVKLYHDKKYPSSLEIPVLE